MTGRMRRVAQLSSRPRPQVCAKLYDTIHSLGVVLGGCERIQGTPLPYAYVAHLHSFLLLILSAVPIVYACEWGWATLPLAPLIAYFMTSSMLYLPSGLIRIRSPATSRICAKFMFFQGDRPPRTALEHACLQRRS